MFFSSEGDAAIWLYKRWFGNDPWEYVGRLVPEFPKPVAEYNELLIHFQNFPCDYEMDNDGVYYSADDRCDACGGGIRGETHSHRPVMLPGHTSWEYQCYTCGKCFVDEADLVKCYQEHEKRNEIITHECGTCGMVGSAKGIIEHRCEGAGQ